MIDQLNALDLAILYKLNVAWATPWSDIFWANITQLHKLKFFMFGVVPLLVLWPLYVYKLSAVKIFVALGLTVGLTDTLAYRGIKRHVDRARPFNNPKLTWLVKKGEAHGPSFPSNHAANCFAGASVLAWFFRRGRYVFFLGALLIALSRPALGVHYPSDAFGGMVLGYLVAMFMRGFVLNQVRWFQLPVDLSSDEVSEPSWRVRAERTIS